MHIVDSDILGEGKNKMLVHRPTSSITFQRIKIINIQVIRVHDLRKVGVRVWYSLVNIEVVLKLQGAKQKKNQRVLELRWYEETSTYSQVAKNCPISYHVAE